MRISSQYTVQSDEQLMSLLERGDKFAFDELYARYARMMKNYFKRMLWNDLEKAEDFVHDLFAKIIKNPTSFDSSRTFKTWFFSVANNMCKNEYKKQEVRKGMKSGLDELGIVYDAHVDVLGEVQDAIFGNAFEYHLKQLDQKHREVFSLRHLDGLSIKEISEVIEVNEGTVKSRLFYATKYLAESLKEFNPILNR
jgi:RNA polymerase sigma-70 factor (ECF subfamily)